MIRYGIVGCGSMGREHIENLRALDGQAPPQRRDHRLVVTALADPHPPSRDAALAICRGGEPPRVFDDPGELIRSGLCDAVVVATPNHTHAAVLRQALAVPGLHVLAEKPLVTRIDDGLELLALERARHRAAPADAGESGAGIVWVAQEYRYMPPVAEMIRLAHAGEAGRLHQVAIREHREPFYPKVGDWNRFSANTGGTLVEKCCHYFNLMELILREPAQRVFASGGQRVNHLDERYDGGPGGARVPDILDSAYVVVEYAGGARAMLDLCMFAESTTDNEHVVVVGDEGKLESLLPSLTLRVGRREDWGRRSAWGEPSGTGRGISVRRVWDTRIRYAGAHFGASYIEHQRFAAAIAQGTPPEIPLAEGLRAVAVGLAAHRSIDEGRVVALDELLPPGWDGDGDIASGKAAA